MVQEKLQIHPYDYWMIQKESFDGDEIQGFYSKFKRINKHLIKQDGVSSNGEWMWLFHGNECDFFHKSDGRKLTVAFGPRGRIDTFNPWTLLNFIQNSKAPWEEYRELKEYLKVDPPEKISALIDSLLQEGLLETADPKVCALVEKYTIMNEDGFLELCIPEAEMPEYSFETNVCDRLVISKKGLASL